MAEQQQDVDTLKRRGRRRLVGAVALVLLAVIVLPMVFDPEPRQPGPPVSVRIPGEDDTPFKPKAVPEKKQVTVKPAPEKKEEAKKEEPKEEKKEVARPDGEQFMVPVGAYANPQNVIAKLAAAKLPYYTEEVPTAKGKVTRVRAGPFASRSAAEKAAEKLKGLGLQPGTVTAKSG
jgi:DedD protein